MEKSEIFRFRIEPELLDRLRAYASKVGKSSAEVIRAYIKKLPKEGE